MPLPPYKEFELQDAACFSFILEVLFSKAYIQHLLPNFYMYAIQPWFYTGIVGDC